MTWGVAPYDARVEGGNRIDRDGCDACRCSPAARSGPHRLPTTTTAATTSTTTTTHDDPADHDDVDHNDHPSTTTTSTTTTTTIPLITEGAVAIVANASGVNGAARILTDEFDCARLPHGRRDEHGGLEEKLDVSKVYYLPAGADVATSIGRIMGGVVVTRMPVPVSITGRPARLGDATVVVMLGQDLASNQPILPQT